MGSARGGCILAESGENESDRGMRADHTAFLLYSHMCMALVRSAAATYTSPRRSSQTW